MLFVDCALNMTAMEDELLKALESVANEPFNLSHHVVYIRLALQMENGREIAADARSAQPQYQQVICVLGAYRSPTINLTHI